jgi:hypothetical protein
MLRAMRPRQAARVPLGLLLALAPLQESAREVRLEEFALTLALPPLQGLSEPGTQRWQGTLGASRVELAFKTLPIEKYGFVEPEDVLDIGPSHWSQPEQARNDPAQRRLLPGAFGHAAYAAFERTLLRRNAEDAAHALRFQLGGLLEHHGYWLTLEATPPPTDAEESVLEEFFLRGIRYDGPVRDSRWTAAEAEARWRRDAPLHLAEELEPPTRTAHYLVLTNSKAGAAFARKLEEAYTAVQKALPFPEISTRRLLPVFLFRSAEEYLEFTANSLRGRGAEDSRGHAARDYYATWNDSPADPVHRRGAARQLLSVRLAVGGGVPWLLDGLATALATKPSERAREKDAVSVPMSEVVKRGLAIEGALAAQVASFLDFLREEKALRAQFPAFVARAGRLPKNDLPGLERLLQELYGCDLATLERRWIEGNGKR